MSEILIKVDKVSKKFCRDLKRSLWYGVKDIGSELFGGQNGSADTLRKDEFWAVKDVSFELKRGECLGLIGHNGAGKSTLLKMLNGLIKPDSGMITMKGRVGALIELGAGFNPILTGRENVYINGAVLGFSKTEIDRKFDTIVQFAEIGNFIDSPVQNYSSGMKVRLGFAIAAQMEPDILIIDEVLAVGDVGFRIKCLNRISELIEKTAVIFVSHSMPQVSKICNSLILMSNGEIMYTGENVNVGVEQYYDLFEGGRFNRIENGISLQGYMITDKENEILSLHAPDIKRFFNIEYLADLFIRFEVANSSIYSEFGIIIRFYDKSLVSVATCQNTIVGAHERIIIQIPKIQFGAGRYDIDLFFAYYDEAGNERILSYYKNIASINVLNSPIENHSSFQLVSNIL